MKAKGNSAEINWENSMSRKISVSTLPIISLSLVATLLIALVIIRGGYESMFVFAISVIYTNLMMVMIRSIKSKGFYNNNEQPSCSSSNDSSKIYYESVVDRMEDNKAQGFDCFDQEKIINDYKIAQAIVDDKRNDYCLIAKHYDGRLLTFKAM